MTVKELMTSSPTTISQHDTLAEAARRMWDQDCGALPVVDGAGVPIAMITDRDICMATWSRGLAPDRVRVSQAMSKTVVVCLQTDPLETAEAAMRLGRVRRLPVVDERHALVGILSLADLSRAPQGSGRKHSQADAQVAATLLAICREEQDGDAIRAA